MPIIGIPQIPVNTTSPNNYYVATFGNLSTQGNVAIAPNSNYNVAGLNFTASGTQYTVGYGSTGTLTLDNGGGGASILLNSGAVNGPTISCGLILADSSGQTAFNISSGNSLVVTGVISQSSSPEAITLNGAGSLELDGNNTYAGGTTVNGGTLNVAAGEDNNAMTDGNLGAGPLTINAQSDNVVSTVNLYNSMTIDGLAGAVSGTGSSATLNVVGSTTAVTLVQSTSGPYGGAINVSSGSSLAVQGGSSTLTLTGPLSVGTQAGGSGTLTVNSGTLAVNAALALYGSSSVNVNGGMLSFNINSGNSTIGSGVSVTVQPAAMLQLAGSVSALSDPNSGNLATINNHGSIAQSGGLYVTGATSQTVGVVTGTGTTSMTTGATTYDGDTVVGDGMNAANLTATQILQNSLTINAGSTVTIAPSGSGTMTASPSTSAAVAGSSADVATSDAASGGTNDPFTAIQQAIADGAISSTDRSSARKPHRRDRALGGD